MRKIPRGWFYLGPTAYSKSAGGMEPAPTTALLTTCNTPEVKTIKIGLLAPFSGPFAANAGDFANAATTAADERNGACGVCGADARYKFQLVKADTESQRRTRW